MSTAVEITFDNPAPGACPADFSALVALLRTLVSGEITTDFQTFVVSASTPSVDDQDKLWFKVDGSGRPLGIFKYYSGNWRRFYNGVLGEVRMFNGDPTGKFDGTGKGILGTDWDGWALMNGNNGTENISNLFIIAAHMDGSGGIAQYASSHWRTNIQNDGGSSRGGAVDVTLDSATGYYPALPEIKVWKWEADGNTGSDER
jgi:hypothetical protein